MGHKEVFEKRLVVIDRFNRNEQMGWFDGQFNVILRLTWTNDHMNGNAYTYLMDNNELVCFGKFLAELESANNTIVKIEMFAPDYDKSYREIKKEDIYSYRKSKEDNT